MTERSSLLDRRRTSNNHTYNTLNVPLPPPFEDLPNSAPPTATVFHTSSQGTPAVSPRGEHRFRIFNKRTGYYDDDRQGLVKENTGVRVWSESYSSIDWIHDRIKEGVRLRKLRDGPGLRGQWEKAKDASQAWILVTIIGVTVSAFAWFIDVVQEWMSDLKEGYCTTHWRYNHNFCCWDKSEYEACSDWKSWSEVFNVETKSYGIYVSFLMYTGFGLLFSLVAALMVKYSAEKVTTRVPSKPAPFSKSPSLASMPRDIYVDNTPTMLKSNEPEYKTETKIAYYSAGSGIPEVKVILGGFVIKGFLGIKTLMVKSVGMIFSTSAGLTCGKEGPFVHLACSAGNIACRLFAKFNKNESKRREILSAAAAAGVSVAFGAPIGGVLFSLEEVSYYFPIKTMIRSYCCAMVAATMLKIADPFGTGKIVLFQVHYDKEYHLFEMVPFILCGAFAGFFGAFMTYFNIKYQHFRRSTVIGKWPVAEVLGIMLLTAISGFWNPFTRLSLSEFAANLFSECSPNNDNAGLCVMTTGEIPRILYLLFTALIIKMGLTIITFGCRVPGGIFLPALVIGAVTGRIIGLIMQYLTLTYPNLWPFTVCAEDLATRGECVIPGVYAMVGAAAGLAGVTRTTVSLVVIMFELTYSLTYALPIMIAVMVAKWVADAMFVEGIYDLLIDLGQYPYLEARKEYVHTLTIPDLTEYLPVIDVDQTITVEKIRQKMDIIASLGYREDGGFPILSSTNGLEGYIATSELTHALDQLLSSFDGIPMISDQDKNDLPVYFRKSRRHPTEEQQPTGIGALVASIMEEEEDYTGHQPLNDFSQYVDQAPLTINQHASMELLMEMFIKLGARYVCVTQSNGRFLGIIHKRRLLAYLKELDED
ncbi:chloride channel [Radiomyces spectabilis]|uniref:chloride channel n=1 Tax=Radiomyces spectabilis TaxID=64574 RepID=UPI00221EDB91|nr:chloride channel [Radiomyces spectabilis]KAI8394188.1 chloride channel [Radiomyces spectabilis]